MKLNADAPTLNFVAGLVLAFVLTLAMWFPSGQALRHERDRLRATVAVQGHELDVIAQRCAVNRVDGSAVCPAGVFATVRSAP